MEIEKELRDLFERRNALTDLDRERVEQLAMENEVVIINKHCAMCYVEAIVQIFTKRGFSIPRITKPTASGHYRFIGKRSGLWRPYGIVLNENTPDEVIERLRAIPACSHLYEPIEPTTTNEES